MSGKPVKKKAASPANTEDYSGLVGGVSELLEAARRTSARTVNALMTATYWEIGRRIMNFEKHGRDRATYGDAVVERLAEDLSARLGRGFSRRNVFLMRAFYLAFPQPAVNRPAPTSGLEPRVQTASARLETDGAHGKIVQTPSAQSHAAGKRAASSVEPTRDSIPQTLSAKLADPKKSQTPSGESTISEKRSASTNKFPEVPMEQFPSAPFNLAALARAFPLPWSHYVLLISRTRSPEAFAFYHSEALRGGWSVRQLQRQIDSQFYERTAHSRNKSAMLAEGTKASPGDAVSAEEEIRHPLILEFLGLRDEYSETDLEDALIRHLETFLLELGNDFAFVGRQRRLRIDDEWYRVDLLFFHRGLRCLVIFDLKLGRFTHADAGQMHVYLNYAREHWAQPGENPPIGVILCSGKSEALVRYATDMLPTKLLVREYLTALPDEKNLAAELQKTRRQLEARK